jgi:lipoate-protein ligase A
MAGLLTRRHGSITQIAKCNIGRRLFTSYTSSPRSPLQIFHSTSRDPYLNLSIEHHLLTKSHPDSTVLFLYVNEPSVVVGRNQNPWLEANLSSLRAGLLNSTSEPPEPINLVRRRSGGGAVFHDEGNANWSVICPSAVFDRDRHAEMVVRVLKRLGVEGVRVNSRHDIVQDVGENKDDTFKVSGSAYKLTRLRSLHHGTCLLSSPNLSRLSGFLRSPAEPFIKARGVESVRSKVRNVSVQYPPFLNAVVDEFQGMYGPVEGGGRAVGSDALEIPEVKKGVDELRSPEWIYGQTPQFTFSTVASDEDPRPRPALPDWLPEDVSLSWLHIRALGVNDKLTWFCSSV